ncbi:MAG: hypothetical protein NTY19_34230 [Planctomycetota bacterium]|nr:hypothetical protein [Planctomycetota bacterium]
MNAVDDEVEESRIDLPPLRAAAESTKCPCPSPSRVLSRLLRMADGYRRSGSPKQAIEIYFELADRNAETPEGQTACERLMEIAEEYEQQGLARQARGIYERLL